MKRLMLAAAVIAAIALTGIAGWLLLRDTGSTQMPGESYRVAAIMQTPSNQFWSIAWEGLKDAAPEYALIISEYPFDERAETEALFETALLSRVDGIVLCPPNELSAHFAGLLDQAHEQGVALVYVDVDAGARYHGVFIGADNALGGQALADEIHAVMRPDDTIVLLGSEDTTSGAILQRRSAFLAHAHALGFSDAVQRMDFRSEDADALTRLHDLLRSDSPPNHIVAASPGSTLAAAQLVSKLNLSGVVRVYGFSETREALTYVENNTIAALVAQQNNDMGRLAAAALHDQLAGKKPRTRAIYLPLSIITPENIAENTLAQRILNGA